MWQQLILLLPKRKWRKGGSGRPPARQVFNGILYLTKTGCQWRMLPPTFGCWQTVYGYFNRWQKQGVFERVQQVLTRRERKRQGRKAVGCQPKCQDSNTRRIKGLRCWQKDQLRSDSSSAPMSRLPISKIVMA